MYREPEQEKIIHGIVVTFIQRKRYEHLYWNHNITIIKRMIFSTGDFIALRVQSIAEHVQTKYFLLTRNY